MDDHVNCASSPAPTEHPNGDAAPSPRQDAPPSEQAPATGDFISAYAEYADVFEIPRTSHEWAAIQLIASLLNAKVQIPNGGQTLTLDLWILFLSASGMGRNTAIEVARGVVDQTGIQSLVRNATWGSAPAFYQQLAESPFGLYVWPEWSVVAKTFNNPQFGGIKEWLTDRYDNPRTPDDFFYRQTGKKTDTPPIHFSTAPRTNIFASSSEDWFVSNLEQPDVTGGFIPRFVLVRLPHSNRLIPKPLAPDAMRIGPLAERLQAISQLEGNAQFTSDADRLYELWYRESYKRFEGQPNPAIAMPFFSRLRGQVLKLALIFEVSVSLSLNVSGEAMQGAISTAREIERTIFEILPTGMNREGAEVEKISEVILKAGSDGMLQGNLTLAFKHSKRREREDRLNTLLESETVYGFVRPTRGRRARVYVHKEHLKDYKRRHPKDEPWPLE